MGSALLKGGGPVQGVVAGRRDLVKGSRGGGVAFGDKAYPHGTTCIITEHWPA